MTEKAMNSKSGHKVLLVVAGLLTTLTVSVASIPFLAGALGISTGAASAVVGFLTSLGAAAWLIDAASWVGVATGVGAISAGIIATVLFLIHQYGKAKAVVW